METIRDYSFTLIRGGLTFLDNTLVYFTNKKPSRGPMFVAWDVTFRCNARCSFCNTHELDKATPREMTTEEALKLVKEMGEAGVWHLSLTGGETLVRKDLIEIIREAKKYGIIVNVNTNGFLLAKHAMNLVESGVDSFTISIDSHKNEVHDEARNIPRLTESIVKGIEEVKKIRKGCKPTVMIRLVVSKQNYDEIDLYIEKYKDVADKIMFHPIHDGVGVPKFLEKQDSITHTGLLNLADTDKDPYQFQIEDRQLFSEKFKNYFKKYKWMNNLFNRDMVKFIFDKDSMWDEYKCYAGYYYLQLDPYGKTFPCQFLFNEVGNVNESGIMNVWKNEKFNQWRHMVKNKQNKCLCWCGMAQVNAVFTKTIDNKLIQGASKLIKGN